MPSSNADSLMHSRLIDWSVLISAGVKLQLCCELPIGSGGEGKRTPLRIRKSAHRAGSRQRRDDVSPFDRRTQTV